MIKRIEHTEAALLQRMDKDRDEILTSVNQLRTDLTQQMQQMMMWFRQSCSFQQNESHNMVSKINFKHNYFFVTLIAVLFILIYTYIVVWREHTGKLSI